MKNRAICISVLAFAAGSGCSAAEGELGGSGELSHVQSPGSEDTPSEGAVPERSAASAALEELHRFEVQGSTYTYLHDGADVLLNVRTSRRAARLHVETASGVEPTLLELFNALQPGVEPHQLLVASHRQSVPVLGRADASVLPAVLVSTEPDEVVAKTAADLTDCRNYFLGVWGGGFGGGTPVVTSQEGTSAGTTVQASTTSVAQKFMAAGACNFSAVQPREVAFDKRINAAGAWTAQLTVDLAVDDANYIVHSPSAQIVNLRSRMVDAANNGMQLVAARRL